MVFYVLLLQWQICIARFDMKALVLFYYVISDEIYGCYLEASRIVC